MSLSVVYFLLATLASSAGILVVMIVKAGLRRHISARLQYRLDLVFLVLLAIPFIPRELFGWLFSVLSLRNRLGSFYFEGIAAANMIALAGDPMVNGTGWLHDFAVSGGYAPPGYTALALVGIWAAGVILFTVVMVSCNCRLRLVRESVMPARDAGLLELFSCCKAMMGVRDNIVLGTSVLAQAPMTIGLIKTQIILPANEMPLMDTRYAMLHELAHCKSKDVLINIAMCLFQILHWFNPPVYFAFRQMRLDRELACDEAVLEMLPREAYIDYGGALISFAGCMPRPAMFSMAAGIGGTRPQIVKRVRHIASYSGKSRFSKSKSVCVLAIVGLLLLCQITAISTLANTGGSDRFHFATGNMQYVDLSRFFGDFEGSFVLYELDAGMYTIHNRSMSTTRVSPNSTYKIVSALVAMEAGVLDAASTHREWDGTVHPFEAWNQAQCLASAMRYSVNWYFQELDMRVGMDVLQSYMSRLHYGNGNLAGGITDFWIESSLRISPVEQVMLLRGLYQNESIFEAGHVDTLKDALRLYERDGAVLSGKTGTGIVNGRFANGWFVGYVETDGRVFIFATYIQGEDNAGGSAASRITLAILEDMGVF